MQGELPLGRTRLLEIYNFLVFLAALRSMWDLSSLIRDRTHVA